MPNLQKETGIEDEPWERIRKAMCDINIQRHLICESERRITMATEEIAYVLWPRTEKRELLCTQCGAGPYQYCTHKR